MSPLARTTLASLAALVVAAGLLTAPTPAATAADTPGTTGAAGTSAPARTPAPPAKPGTVLRSGPLKRSIWVPGTTSRAYKLTYVTTDAFGERTTSTGTVMYPKGTPPKGGWPVISWAHGTSGLGDSCAPSRIGPAFKARDWAYLATWMKQGYAIVASDYAGLGTPGKHAYLDGRTTAHNVVDMVKAGHAFAADRPARQRLARKWVVLGQSQGAGAAIATASFATEFGGPRLDFRGGVGTGTPAYIEALVSAAGPGVLPVDASPALTTYLLYILAGMRFAHPELRIDSALNATGRRLVDLAETACDAALERRVTGTPIGALFRRALATLPGFVATARAYLGMPETSFEKPVFLANGLIDTDVPMETTAAYVAVLTANGADVIFRTYPGDHNTTMAMSLPDSVPFVRRLFRTAASHHDRATTTAHPDDAAARTKAPKRVTTWAPVAKATITPGVMMYTKGAQCTANFVYNDAVGNVYVGYAAHCAGTGSATDTDGCATSSLPLGTPVSFVEGGSVASGGTKLGSGTLVYSSWLTEARLGTTHAATCAYNDLALVKVAAAHEKRVNPSVPFWGGPSGIDGNGAAAGDKVYSYGNSSLRAGLAVLSPKLGVALGDAAADQGWNHPLYTVTPGIPGDSGSGFMTAGGKAIGTLSTVVIAPLPLSNQIGDLAKELAFAQAHSGIRGLRLVKGTTAFSSVL